MVKHLFKWGAKTFFWEDIWKGDIPIRTQFPDLYQMWSHPWARVADCWDGEDRNIPFRRSLITSEKYCLDRLLLWLRSSPLDIGQDNIIWASDKTRTFSTKSLYSFMTNKVVVLKDSNSFWNARIPLKITVFLWQLSNDRLQTAMALQHRGWQGSHLCCLCGKHTGEHQPHLL